MTKRVLYVLYNLERGGIQQWLINVLRNIDKDKYHIDIMIFEEVPSPFTEEIIKLGSNIILCPNHRRFLIFIRNFLIILKKYGPYDVVHSNTSYHSGIELFAAAIAGIKVRISHIHSDLSKVNSNATLFRKLYNRTMICMVKIFATNFIGVSDFAGRSFFGKNWLKNKRSKLIYCGLDFTGFKKKTNSSLKKSFAIPKDSMVIGHVGRFSKPKNHNFIIDVFYIISQNDPDVRLVLVGEGELLESVKSKVKSLGIDDKVVFTGGRSDVPDILNSVFDVVLFPSLYEGLGLIILEALASGLPCVLSDNLSPETYVIPKLIRTLSLENDSKEVWAKKVGKLLQKPPAIPRKEAYKKMIESQFTIEKSLENITKLYA